MQLGRPIRLKSILYFIVIGIALIVFYNIPILGLLINWMPVGVLLLIPVGLAWLLSDIGTEGRSPVFFFRSFLSYQYRKFVKKEVMYRGKPLKKPRNYQFKGYLTFAIPEHELIEEMESETLKEEFVPEQNENQTMLPMVVPTLVEKEENEKVKVKKVKKAKKLRKVKKQRKFTDTFIIFKRKEKVREDEQEIEEEVVSHQRELIFDAVVNISDKPNGAKEIEVDAPIKNEDTFKRAVDEREVINSKNSLNDAVRGEQYEKGVRKVIELKEPMNIVVSKKLEVVETKKKINLPKLKPINMDELLSPKDKEEKEQEKLKEDVFKLLKIDTSSISKKEKPKKKKLFSKSKRN